MAALSGISGLVAGFSTKDAVDELLGFRKFEISQLTKKQDAETAKQTALGELNTLLANFRTTSMDMKDADKFFSYTASLNSSNAAVPASSLLDVAGDNSVTAGNHTMVVNQLATSARSSSSVAVKDLAGVVVTSDATALNLTGSFQLNGTQIAITSADSLQDIAGNINSKSTGVTASVIKVDNSDYRLVLAADVTGSTGFSLSGPALDVGNALAGLQIGASGQSNASQILQTAQDAKVTIDGLTVTRSSNTISDALSGITLTLRQANPLVSVNMTIGVDTADVQSKVQSFVDAYNDVFSYVNKQFTFNTDTGETGVLAGEAILTSIQGMMTSSLLQNVSGLASDRDSLVKIGVEPDQTGKLIINDDFFTNFLNNDPSAIRDVFVAQGSSAVNGLSFLVPGTDTLSGVYAVNLTSAASRASLTGTADLSVALLADSTVTITEAGNERQTILTLTAGSTQAQIVSDMNAEFAKEMTEKRLFDTALLVGGAAVTGGTLFSNIDGAGVLAGDKITISGTNRSGVAINNTFTVLDPTKDTLSDLLSSIQSAFGQQVTASIDASGRIQVRDNSSGDSKLTVSLTPNNTGGGALNLGVDTSTALTVEGRFALSLEAVTSGNNVTIQHKSVGASSGFYISGAATSLGIADVLSAAAIKGTDVAGTINGETATGRGQVLVGNAGNADGIGLLYSGSAIGSIGNVTIGVGVAALFDGKVDLFSNLFTGLVQNTVRASEDIFTTLTDRITSLESQMEKQRVTLVRSFIRMESSMNVLQGQGNYITQQIDAQNAG